MRAWLKSFFVIGGLAIGMSPPHAQSKHESDNAASKIQVTEGRTNRGGLEVIDRVGDVESETPKSQAISVLREIVDHADQFANYESKGMLIGSALDLLWKHDVSYARSSFHQALDRFFVQYSSKTNTTAQRNQILLGIMSLISKLAKNDPAAGARCLSSFGTLVEEFNENKRLSVNDQLSVAQSSLALDAKQSAMLAARMLNAGVPSTFPNYLYELETKDSESAVSLYRVSLSNLTSNPIYTPVHATILSAYAFREKLLVLQVRSNSKKSSHIEFGSFAANLSPGPGTLRLDIVNSYLSAAYRFLEARLIFLQKQPTLDQETLIQCYFLARKLNRYAVRLRTQEGPWEQLASYYEILCQRAGLTISELASLDRTAERLVNEGTIFEFDDGASAFETAKLSRDAGEKTALMVKGIHELVEAGKFSEAEQRIIELKDHPVMDRMMDYLHFQMGRAAIRKRKWRDLVQHEIKITEPALRVYLFLEGTEAALKFERKNIASDYLQSAMRVLPEIDDKSVKAKATVAISGLLASLDAAESGQAILDAATEINKAEGYDGGNYSVTFELPKLKLLFALSGSSLDTCFERSAKADWVNTINAASTISRTEIRRMAQIAACRSVL
jgi:hypothetical protein